MASLIAPLASGVNGAPSGTAEIYQRGTTSTAVAYSDPDLATAQTLHTLDGNGGVTRYVNQSVDVIVKNAAGVVVRTFTWEDYAASVEVRNVGFTGTLANGSQGAGGRTDVDKVLSSIFSSFGGLDGKILVGGAGQNAKDLLANTTNVFFNVTSTAYGAKGDDTTDDTSAIQAAINAAVAAGGGIVYFPPGTYKVTATLSVTTSKVQFLGVTAAASIIKNYGAATAALTVSNTDFYCANIAFSNSTTGNCISVTGGSAIDDMFVRCAFTVSSGTAILGGGTRSRFIGCNVTTAAGGIGMSGAGSAHFASCEFTQGAATGSMFTATGGISIVGGRLSIPTASSAVCFSGTGTFSLSGLTIVPPATAGTFNLIAGTSTVVSLSGCVLGSVSTGTYSLCAAGTNRVSESGCSVYGGPLATNCVLNATQSTSRAQIVTVVSSSVTTYTPDPNVAEIFDVTTNGASFVFASPTLPLGGAGVGLTWKLVLRYKNTNAGAITPTFGALYKVGTVPSVATNSGASWTFLYDSTSANWYQVGGNSSAFAS